MKKLFRVAAGFGCIAAAAVSAQPASAPAAAMPYTGVAEALKALEARDGDGAIVTHADGWTIVSEPAMAAQWSFTPSGHYAHPAVVRRVIRRTGGDVAVEISTLCEAPQASCTRLVEEFEQFNERIRQSVKSRQRPAATPAPR